MRDIDIIKKILAPNAFVVQKEDTIDWTNNTHSEILFWNHSPSSPQEGRLIKFRYVNNPDGTIRWFFPNDLKYPSFLTLYNASGLKSKLIKQAFNWTFRLGLKGVLSQGEFYLWTKNETPFQQLIQSVGADGYSVFTGTVGKNRKAIIEINKKRSTTNFIKYPISENSIGLIRLEKTNLQALSLYQFTKSVLPTVTPFIANESIAILSNVNPKMPTINLMDLEKNHLIAIEEWIEKTQEAQALKDISAIQTIQESLEALNANHQPVNELAIEKVKQLLKGLNQLFESLDLTQVTPVAMAHCDFTPWNMYYGVDKIYVYDWELAKMDMPMLFDAFHFIFQSSILIKRIPFEAFKPNIGALKNHSITTNLKTKYQFDFDQSYQLYLLYNVSYYLNLYVRQKDLHIQAHWLIDTWLDAVNESVNG